MLNTNQSPNSSPSTNVSAKLFDFGASTGPALSAAALAVTAPDSNSELPEFGPRTSPLCFSEHPIGLNLQIAEEEAFENREEFLRRSCSEEGRETG